jgi:hypothetical protein
MHFLRRWAIRIVVIALILFIGNWWVTKNNPYSANTWVKPFYSTTIQPNGNITLAKIRDLHVTSAPVGRIALYLSIPFQVGHNIFFPEQPIEGTAPQIITQLHQERFNLDKAYVITGGHFPQLYVRNFGIFYGAMLDPRIQDGTDDWTTRERVTLQTTAVDLELLSKAGKEYTTFVPISSTIFAGANFNAAPLDPRIEPSDSLFAIVYSLNALSDPNFIAGNIPDGHTPAYTLNTKDAATQLVTVYKPAIEKELARYLSVVMDPQSGLVKKSAVLSGARDRARGRQSSFYDNMIAWATAKDAAKLGLTVACPVAYNTNGNCDYGEWKRIIITNFWDDTDGLFINDLSKTSQQEHTFTGEAFLAPQIGFLDSHDDADRTKLARMVSYVKAHDLDKPFPLYYAASSTSDTSFIARLTGEQYANHSIWSNLGQAYIETLVLLSSDHPDMLSDARKYLDRYRQNMETYGGYPELYNENGELFSVPFYRAVLHVGWVINYEQAQMLYDDATQPFIATVH